MIIDTTYILPLVGIAIKTDLLRAIAERRLRIKIDFSDLKLSLISVFELQAKASKLNVPPNIVSRAIDVILRAFEVIPFYRRNIIEKAHELREYINDYIDCIIVATAVVLKEDVVTEDTIIISIRKIIEEKYNIRVVNYEELLL